MLKPFKYVALIAAAGVGSRMGSSIGPGTPKQYLQLAGRTMLEHSIAALGADSRIDRIFVIVAPSDVKWRSIRVGPRVEFVPVGGSSRAESVRNGLQAIAASVHADDRVVVHDAARPCLGAAELGRLLDQVGDDPRGGLLAMPVTDTLKRGAGDRAVATVERNGLWCAQTPQMFPMASLRAALEVSSFDGLTDEASAIEKRGDAPRLVLGSATNIKITSADDLTLACAILADREQLARSTL